MLSFWIVHRDIKLWLREKQTFILLMAMPLLLIGILGMAFSSMMGSADDDAGLGPFPIAVVDLDQSEHSVRIQDDLLGTELSDMIHISKLSLDEAEAGLKDNSIDHMLILPAGLGDAITDGTKPQVQLISQTESTVLPIVLSNSLQQYGSIVTSIDGMIEVLKTHYIELVQQGEPLDPTTIESTIRDTLSTQYDNLEPPFLETSVKGDERELVGSFQYYSVAMGVMYLLMTIVMFVTVMIKEKNDAVHNRQFMSRLTAKDYLLGKFFGTFLVGMIQLSILILGTFLIFGVSWGSSIAGIVLTMVSFTIKTAGLAVCVGSFIKKEGTFTAIGMIATQIFAALGGSFAAIYFLPDIMQKLGHYLPNTLALNMFLEVMSGGNVSDIWQDALTAVAVGVVLMVIAWLRLARNGGVSRV